MQASSYYFRAIAPAASFLSLVLASCQTTPPTTITSPIVSVPTTTPAAPLRNTRWVLRTVNNQPAPTPANGEPYLLLRNNELNAEGNGGCNRFRGSFELPADGQLRFGPLLSTKMACPDLSTESAFLDVLSKTRSYHISGDTLHLFGETATQPSAVLHAVYLH